ncbi:MAG: DUF6265 family protein [Rubricoccaceae bacterium]|nr:DUF6265 family protein [Rubricoccaceae bacterium]
MRALLLLPLAALVAAAAAQTRPSPNTLGLDPALPRPTAVADDLAWIAGHWQGEALGGYAEEIWATPRGGALMGVFRLVRNDAIAFYEILTIAEDDDGSLTLRLKHFNADLTGWEAQHDVVRFPLVRLDPDAAYFDGMTIRRDGPDALTVVVAVERDQGGDAEAVFHYRRRAP